MNLNNLNEEQITYILDGLEALCHAEDVTMEDIMRISILHQTIDEATREIIHRANNEELPETLARAPNKGERQVLGRAEYVKDTRVG